MIKLSESAKKMVLNIMNDESMSSDEYYLVVEVISGGCSGLSHKMDIKKDITGYDEIFEDNGIKIATNSKSLLYLMGTILEYSGGLNGKGFWWNNPNASRVCSCGESFSL